MGFKIEFNSILRIDFSEPLNTEQEYIFENEGSRVYFDDIPIWLVKKDWTALAEITITRQARRNNKVTGTFKVNHIYTAEESKTVTEIFRRMYGWK